MGGEGKGVGRAQGVRLGVGDNVSQYLMQQRGRLLFATRGASWILFPHPSLLPPMTLIIWWTTVTLRETTAWYVNGSDG